MRYLSLFDGIGAACVAWEPLGWQCVGVSEIEPFPVAVTSHHRPHVPHLGDVTKITDEQIEALGQIDLEGLSVIEEGGFSPYMFALGEVIALMDVFGWRLDHVNALRHLLLGASRDEIGEAVVAMLHKLQK